MEGSVRDIVAVAAEVQSFGIDLKDADAVAAFLNRRLGLLEARRREEEAKVIGPNESGWGILPDLILEKIFSYLSISQRYYASCTCKQWYWAFHLRKVWQNMVLVDQTLTRRRYDYGEKNWRHVLDHHRSQKLLAHVGHYFRTLTLLPTSFYGLFAHYHFMNHVSSYSERYYKNPDDPTGCHFQIKTMRFVFFCDITTGRENHYVYGTGGEILASIKRLIGNLHYLENLQLVDLLLEPKEAIHLLDEACDVLCEKIRTLTLINATKDEFTLLHPACFVNLRVLRITPQNIGEEMIEMLSNCNWLEQLHIIQTSYTGNALPIPATTWFKVNHLFQVYLRTSTLEDKEILWQERANVVSVLYECPFTKFSVSSVLTVIDLYSDTLHEYGHFGLPKFRSSRKFVNRVDGPLLNLCRRCPYLTTLFVRDRISTSTALLMASMAANLKNLYIRRNALLKKCDFMFHFNLFLDYNFTQWIKLNAKSYDKTRREISKIMATDWKPLTDKDFKSLKNRYAAY